MAKKQYETGSSRVEEPQGLQADWIDERMLRSGTLWRPDGYTCGGYRPNPCTGCGTIQQAFSFSGARARGVAGLLGTTRRLSSATSAAVAATRTTQRIGIEFVTGLECTVRPCLFSDKVYVLTPPKLRLWPVAQLVGRNCCFLSVQTATKFQHANL